MQITATMFIAALKVGFMAKRVMPTDKPNIQQPVTLASLSELVRYKRTSLGVSIADAALLFGLSKQTYQNIEKGAGNVRAENLFTVLALWGIELQVKAAEDNNDWL